MMERLRERLWLLRQSICAKRKKKVGSAPLKGNMQNVIVVKPQNKMFSQALFILSDDYMRQSRLSSQELLRQAQEAAGEFTPVILPRKRGAAVLKIMLIFLVSTAFLLGTYYFILMPA